MERLLTAIDDLLQSFQNHPQATAALIWVIFFVVIFIGMVLTHFK